MCRNVDVPNTSQLRESSPGLLWHLWFEPPRGSARNRHGGCSWKRSRVADHTRGTRNGTVPQTWGPPARWLGRRASAVVGLDPRRSEAVGSASHSCFSSTS